MKRLILVGGRPWEGTEAKRLVSAILRDSGASVNIALCLFAVPERDRDQTRSWNIDRFSHYCDPKRLHWKVLATEDFAATSSWAHIIYIPGGATHVLREQLASYPELDRLWDNKTIAGSSAGAVSLCTQYVYLQNKTFGEGLGWVPVSAIPHYRDAFEDYTDQDWSYLEAELLKRRPDLPVVGIPEGHFVEVIIS